MVFLPITQTHHPLLLHSQYPRLRYVFILALVFTIPASHAQEITGLEVIKTIEHENYSVAAIDCYFEDGQQLIAYSNNSSGTKGDTLVIYDFLHDLILAEIPGTNWSFDIRFIHADHLLFRNGNTLFRVDQFSAPIVQEVRQSVKTFTVSDDKSTVAILRQVGDVNQVELAGYDYTSGVLTPLGEFVIPDEINDSNSKLNFSRDGGYIALNGGYENNNVYIVNTGTQELSTVPTPDNGGTYSPVFNAQNGFLRLAVGGGFDNGGIEVIDVSALAVEASIPVFLHYNYALAFDQTDGYLVCGGYDGIIKLFKVQGTVFTEKYASNTELTTRIIFTQDNQYVISGHGAGDLAKLVIHRVVSGPSGTTQLSVQPLILHPNPTSGMLHRDGKLPALISIFDNNGRFLFTNYAHGPDIDVSGLPDGLYILKAEDEKEVRTSMFVKS